MAKAFLRSSLRGASLPSPPASSPPQTLPSRRQGHAMSPRSLGNHRCFASGRANGDEEQRGPNEAMRVISVNGQATVTVVQAPAAVDEAIRRHGLSATAAMALGRAMIGGLLLASFQPEEEQANVIVHGDGGLGRVNAIAKAGGQVRGYIENPTFEPPRAEGNALDVPSAIGRAGNLTVVRSHPAMKEPFTGIVPLETGEVAEDLAKYLRDSEQVASAIGIGISFDHDGCRSAGGWLIQQLPFAEEATTQALERNIDALGSTTRLFDDLGMTSDDVVHKLFAGDVLGGLPGQIDQQIAAAERLVPSYGPCGQENLRHRMRRALFSLPPGELDNLLEEQNGQVEVTCHFCNESVTFGRDDLSSSSPSS